MASIMGEPWFQMHSVGWHLDEPSVLMIITKMFVHADRRPHLMGSFLVLVPTLKAFEHRGRRKLKFGLQL